MEDKDVFDYIIQSTADIASIKTTLEESLKPLVDKVNAQEARLGDVESDMRTWKRVFLSLWAMVVLAGTWAIGFFK